MGEVNGSNGSPYKDALGRFVKGWAGGPGNPHVRHLATLRLAVAAAVTPDDILEVMCVLLTKAKAGDIHAIKELFDRTLGPSQPLDLIGRLTEMERRLPETSVLRQQLRDAMAEISRLKLCRPALPLPPPQPQPVTLQE